MRNKTRNLNVSRGRLEMSVAEVAKTSGGSPCRRWRIQPTLNFGYVKAPAAMRVIPVIDLKKGLVVRGVAGDREHYQPIVSSIAADARPSSVAEAFVRQLGLSVFYVADLDAIGGAPPNWRAYQEIAASGATMVIDAGIRDAAAARPLAEFAAETGFVTGIVAALESCRSATDLSAIFSVLGPQRGLFSLDLMNGVPVTSVPAWRESSPPAIVQAVWEIGFRRLIVLDLADVGVGEGTGPMTLCRNLRAARPELELITGGGVRDVDDLRCLARSGCDAALVASSLHDGRVTTDDLHGLSDAARLTT